MKYLPLIWSGIWRRRGRAVLMLLQIVIAFTLFGVLQGVSSGTRQAIAATHSDRLYIASRVSASDPLPIALLDRIRSVPGIRDVSPRAILLGSSGKSVQRFPVIAVEAEPFLRIYDEITVSPDAVKRLAGTPTGALVGSELATRRRMKIGDRMVLQSPTARRDGSHDWSFELVGVYTTHGTYGTPPPTAVIANFDYVNQARATDANRSNMFLATVNSASEAGAVSLAIDNAFANSSHETRTQSEGNLVSTNLKHKVDMDFIVSAEVEAVF
jgi:putative ABC transport system permease protein